MNKAPAFGKELLLISPADIYIPARLGLYFPDKAAALGKLMAVHGQRTPITVRKSAAKVEQPWTLVTGMHRLNGAIIEGLPEVIALERVNLSAATALDEEASENLDRRDQPPLERAIFIHATCEAAKARLGDWSQQQLGAKARWAKVKGGELRAEQVLQEESADAADIVSAAYSWQESVAEAFGRDVRSIRRALTLYRLIVEPFPDLTQALSDHPVGGNAAQLKVIADVKDEAARRQVIELILADKEMSADVARVQAGIDLPSGPAPLPHQRFYDQIEGGWQRLGTAQRREFVARIPAMLGSDDMKRRLRDQLNEELGEARKAAFAVPEVPKPQSQRLASAAIEVINRLLDGSGVEDEELMKLRQQAQGVSFGVAEAEPDEAPIVFPSRRRAEGAE